METQIDALSREAEIEEVMRTTNLMRIEAAALVAGRHGEDVSDIVGPDGPLSEEQRRRLGLGWSIADLVQSETVEDGDAESALART